MDYFIENPKKNNNNDISNCLCHTQAVERSVKLVTEVSGAVCGQTIINGFIRTTIESRKIMPHFHSKKDFRLG